MKSYEKEKAAQLPSEFRPLGAWSYFGYTILFSLPIIGFISLIICACNGSNINRRSFARSYFCGFLIILIVAVVVGIIMGVFYGPLLTQYLNTIKGVIGK